MQFWPTLLIQCVYGIFGREIRNDTVIYSVYTRFWLTLLIQCVYDIFGREITSDTVMYGVYMQLWPTLLIQCAYDISGREITSDTVMYSVVYICSSGQPYLYSVCTISLAGKSQMIRSYTVYIRGSGQPYLYSVCTISLAGQSPMIRSCAVWCIYAVLANPTCVSRAQLFLVTLLLYQSQDLPEDVAKAKRKPLLALIRESFNEYFRIIRYGDLEF